MTNEDRLRLHLAGKGAAWRSDGPFTYAVWDEDGPQAATLPPPPVTAASIVDAYVARPPGTRLTLVHDGPLSPVALRSAARFHITLLDVSALPALPVAPKPTVAEMAPLLPPHEPAPLLPAHVESELPAPPAPVPVEVAPEPAILEIVADAPADAAAPELAPEPVAIEASPELALPEVAPEPVVIVAAPEHVSPEAAPEVLIEAPAPVQEEPAAPDVLIIAPEPATVTLEIDAAPPAEEGPALPWDPRTPLAPQAAHIDVSADELAALPWHAHAPIEEHVEIMPGNPRPRRFGTPDRPTLTGADWGLPWPRPATAPTPDALSLNDPRIWHNAERVHAVRETLDARSGAASFGAVKPDNAAWLRRLESSR